MFFNIQLSSHGYISDLIFMHSVSKQNYMNKMMNSNHIAYILAKKTDRRKAHGPIFHHAEGQSSKGFEKTCAKAMALSKFWVRTLNTQRLNRNCSNMQMSICVAMCKVTQSGVGLLQRDSSEIFGDIWRRKIKWTEGETPKEESGATHSVNTTLLK